LSTTEDEEQESFIFGVVSASTEKPIRDFYGLESYDQWAFVYIPELMTIPATGDEQIQMLTREIMFPSDPLALRQLGIKGTVMMPGGGLPAGGQGQGPKGGTQPLQK
jgi:hypothetical protein